MLTFSTHRRGVCCSVVILFCLLLIVQCAVFRPGPVFEPGLESTQSIHHSIMNHYERLKTLQATGTIVVQTPQRSFRGYIQVYLQKPDSVYIKIEALLGMDIAVLFADHKHFLFYAPMENIVYQSNKGDMMQLDSFIGFNMNKSDFLQLICGCPSLPDGDVQWQTDKFVINHSTETGYESFHIDPYWGAVSRVSVFNTDSTLLQKEEYMQFTRSKGCRLPRLIKFARPLRRQSVTLIYETLKINQNLKPKHFVIKLPDSVIHL